MRSVEQTLVESRRRAADARAELALERAATHRAARTATWALVATVVVYAHVAHGHEDWTFTARLCGAGSALIALGTIASIRRDRLPFLAYAATQLYVYYGLGIFGSAELAGHIGRIPLSAESLEAAAFSVLLCTVAMLAASGLGRRAGAWVAPRFGSLLPRLSPEALPRIAVPFGLAMLGATYLSVFAGDSIPGSLAYVAYSITRPALGQAVLSSAASTPGAPAWLERWFLAFTVGSSVIGLFAGSLFPALAPWVSHAVFIWLRRGSIPWRSGILVLLLFLVLNPAKHVFRDMVWRGTEVGLTERADAWQTAIASTWSEESRAAENVETTTDRLGTLNYAAQAFEWIPAQVPHSGIDRWMSIPAAYIPRALWPDKPELTRVNNAAYTITFGLQTDAASRMTTLVLPLVFDAYWALGWLGIIIAGTLLGLLLGTYEGMFRPHDWAAAAIGVTLMSGLTVHAHLGSTFAGVPQSIVGALAVLWVAAVAARAISGRGDRSGR